MLQWEYMSKQKYFFTRKYNNIFKALSRKGIETDIFDKTFCAKNSKLEIFMSLA